MNQYLKNAVQNLDCHIAQVTAIRDQLAEGVAGPEVPGAAGQVSGTAWAVQTLEPSAAKAMEGRPANRKQRTSKMQKRNGGGRTVKAEGRRQKEETGDFAHGGPGGPQSRPTTPGSTFKPSTLAGAMKFEISRLKAFTLEALQTLVNEKYGGEEFYTKAASNSFNGNLAYWAKTGRLEKSGDGAQASFKVLDAAFFSQVEFQS